jgi:uncharacterized protein YpuA (DUF1002 family)
MTNINKSPDDTGKKQEKRGDIETRFKKGQSGNPKGRPPGSVSITTEIKKRLQEMPDGQKKTYLELLISRILKLGVVDGNEQMIKIIWNYVDGMPNQLLEADINVVTSEANKAKEALKNILNRSLENDKP